MPNEAVKAAYAAVEIALDDLVKAHLKCVLQNLRYGFGSADVSTPDRKQAALDVLNAREDALVATMAARREADRLEGVRSDDIDLIAAADEVVAAQHEYDAARHYVTGCWFMYEGQLGNSRYVFDEARYLRRVKDAMRPIEERRTQAVWALDRLCHG